MGVFSAAWHRARSAPAQRNFANCPCPRQTLSLNTGPRQITLYRSRSRSAAQQSASSAVQDHRLSRGCHARTSATPPRIFACSRQAFLSFATYMEIWCSLLVTEITGVPLTGKYFPASPRSVPARPATGAHLRSALSVQGANRLPSRFRFTREYCDESRTAHREGVPKSLLYHGC